MHTGLLSELERRRIRAYVKADGKKPSALRGLATRCRQSRKQIQEDLDLIDEFLKHYEESQ
ncbi:MAG: hypothetical protein ABSD49_07975 [Candidatus Bathyarchaeia archaeon]